MQSSIKWLYPGMRIKRWLFLIATGTLLVGAGASIAFGVEMFTSLDSKIIRPLAGFFGALPAVLSIVFGSLFVLGGALLMAIGIRQMIRSLTAIFLPGEVDRLAEIVFQQRQLHKGPKIVVVGGGTGLSTLLRGLKVYTQNITAIVTMADDGGSSGRLRTELGILPPGDIRSTLVALADAEPLMQRLFQHRFTLGEGLKDHNFGNLFIAAMTEITGDFEAAVKESSKVLAVRGRVYPSTLEEITLKAEYEDGTVARGESRIGRERKKINRVTLEPYQPAPLEEAIKAIVEADCILLGPGSLYTSIIPNLLVDGVSEAIKDADAVKIYICNVMTQPGETDGMSAGDHVQALFDHVGDAIVDHVILNESFIPGETLARYDAENAHPVRVDSDYLKELGVSLYVADLMTDHDFARHDPYKLARAVTNIMNDENGHAFRDHKHIFGKAGGQ